MGSVGWVGGLEGRVVGRLASADPRVVGRVKLEAYSHHQAACLPHASAC